MQQWFNLSDPAVEEALYDSAVLRQFVGIDLGRELVPDETTACKFRHLLEEHRLGARIFERVQEHLQAKGFLCYGLGWKENLQYVLSRIRLRAAKVINRRLRGTYPHGSCPPAS